MSSESRMRIAVIGAGVGGITSAFLLQSSHDVVLFEKSSRLGGHTNTITIPDGPDAGARVDTGFIVLNDQTYPLFHRFLSRLGVEVRESDMSFSYRSDAANVEYAGTDLHGLFAQRENILRPAFWGMLHGIRRFAKETLAALPGGELDQLSLGDVLRRGKYSPSFRDWYLLPMGSAIWSAPLAEILDFPAATFVRFFKNHGLLALQNRPRWQTVVNGSKTYVERFAEQFPGEIRLNADIASVDRSDSGVSIHFRDRVSEAFDKVVFACHADEALGLIIRPSAEEKAALGAWRYERNLAVLHTDVSVLPKRRRAWASWNYLQEESPGNAAPASVTYHMNRLQGLRCTRDYCVSLNPRRSFPRETVITEITYHHPVFSASSVASQQSLPELNGRRNTYFCGSYFGYGFHEDAVRSADAVGRCFGSAL